MTDGLIGSRGRPRSRWTVAVAAATVLVFATAGCTGEPGPGPSPTSTSTPAQSNGPFAPGADGLGDRYFPKAGNGGYDVGNYDLDIIYEPETKLLTGVATITATATANLTRFNLDFTGLKTTSVTIDGANASAEQRTDGELVVTPSANIGSGTTFTTVVSYGGVPAGIFDVAWGFVGFLTSAEGAVAIGEPKVASSWFPVNDHPRDKATYTIKITAPTARTVLSNGVLQSKQASTRADFTTWTWRVSSPMAPYLATMVVGNYRVQETTHDGKPVVLAVDTSLSTTIDAELGRTPAVIDFLESKFGPYPFDAMGGIVINRPSLGLALENQTRPIYSSVVFDSGVPSQGLAHELAHQWFGDSVSVNEWNEIWLNEGFATYAQWLWLEHEGASTPQAEFDRNYNVPASYWAVAPGDPGPDMFGAGQFAIYPRGAMTLHVVRHAVGDDTFFKILQTWAAQEKDANATTAEFVALAKQISGKDLDKLFNDWLYGDTRPPRP